MVVAIAIPLENDDGVGARLGLVIAAVYGASNRMAGIAVIVDDKVGVSAVAVEPAVDFRLILLESNTHGEFGSGAVGVGRSGRDVALVAQALAKLVVGASNVFLESVASGGFVLREIVRGSRAGLRGSGLRWREGAVGRGLASEQRAQHEEQYGPSSMAGQHIWALESMAQNQVARPPRAIAPYCLALI